jgi:hypothetical protein
MNKKIPIPAVHDKDLRLILDRFGISDKIDNGKVFCINCNENITWKNLFAFKIVGDNIVFFCDQVNCIENSSK